MSALSNILFVTGTDTGIGKTFVASLLVKQLADRGYSIKVSKPVETGCRKDDSGELIAPDAESLLRSSGNMQSIHEAAPYRFSAPAAPSVAAELESVEIDTKALCKELRKIAGSCDLLVVEGAGGLMVPLSANSVFADLCQEIAASSLLVIGSRLGCINHALLSLEVMDRRELPIAGYVFNDLFAEKYSGEQVSYSEALSTNREVLQSFAPRYGARELLYMPYLPESEPAPEAALKGFSEAIIEYFELSR
jgi:dethiobiotin synthetase